MESSVIERRKGGCFFLLNEIHFLMGSIEQCSAVHQSNLAHGECAHFLVQRVECPYLQLKYDGAEER